MDVHASPAELPELKVDDLAQRFHQPRAAVVCHIMHWGLSHGQAEMRDGGASEGQVRHLYLYVDTALHEQVEEAAIAAGVKSAPWLRGMVRQIILTDFPASWQAARLEGRSHDSRIYDTRFMLRLDKTSQTTLQQLITQLGLRKPTSSASSFCKPPGGFPSQLAHEHRSPSHTIGST